MLSKLSQQEKEEIVFNSLVLRHAVDAISSTSKESVQSILGRLTTTAEAYLQALSAAQIDRMIATNDQVRASEEATPVTGVAYIAIGNDLSEPGK
ncbi:MAG: hypothetical protein F6K22_19140 [Okeania sp. SIO2F4]|nr:hypothetical protein [Okeania sp. SIO2F4]